MIETYQRSEKRKLFRRAADIQSDFLQTVINGLSEPIVIIDASYHLKCMNRAARDLVPGFCKKPEPLLCFICNHGKNEPCKESEVTCPMKKVKKTGKPVTVVHEHRLPSNEVRSFEIIAAPLWNHGVFQGIVETMRDITERKIREEEIWHMAHHDALTGLPNRRLFLELMSFGLVEAHRNRMKAGLLFLDLDRFKDINDLLGHEAGDVLLKKVADRFTSAVREVDIVARLGGDEFCVLLAGIEDPKSIIEIVRKILVALKKRCIIAGRTFHITTSIGISIYPDDSPDGHTLFRYADIAMYRAKDRGRNTFEFYNPNILGRTS